MYQPGIYPATCADTHIVIMEPIEVKHLRVLEHGEWQDLMVDDPGHWLSTWEVATRATAPLLIGGLGLGLIHQHLLSNMRIYQVSRVLNLPLTIERSPEIIDMVLPYVELYTGQGKYSTCLEHGDFFDVVPELAKRRNFSTVITDFHMGHEPIDPFITRQQELLNKYMPQAQQLYHAYQNILDYNMLVEKGFIVMEDA